MDIENDTSETTRLTPELAELAALCGCTELQTKFAAALLEGHSYTEAAFRAGYAGARDSVQLRSAGSSAARAKPVQALLALAESRGLGVPNAPGDREELKRILWSHARSKDKAASIRATTELERIEREEHSTGEPEKPLEEIIAGMCEHLSPEMAAELLLGYGLHPENVPKDVLQKAELHLEKLAEDWIRRHPRRAKEHADYWLRNGTGYPDDAYYVEKPA
jgi:hypothetical protein